MLLFMLMIKPYTYILGNLFLLSLLLLAGCIKNDLPYPRIQQNITSISAVGESREALIDSLALSVTLYLDEQVDIESVRFDSFSISEGGSSDPNLLEGTYDLSHPIVVKLTRYQTYQWLVSAIQNIERYLTIEGQIGLSMQ